MALAGEEAMELLRTSGRCVTAVLVDSFLTDSTVLATGAFIRMSDLWPPSPLWALLRTRQTRSQ